MVMAADVVEKPKIQFEVVKHVTLPLLKNPEDGTPIFVTFTGPIFKAKEVAGGRAPKKNADGSPAAAMAPPELAQVTDLARNAPAQIIVNSVMGSELRETYPNDAYVGKSFQIKKFKPTGGKRYALFEILEIRVKATDGATPPPHAKPGSKK